MVWPSMAIPDWYAMCMSQIAVRLSDDELRALDSAVADGSFRSRAEAVRAGIRLLEQKLRETRIATSYRKAYADPLSEDETRVLDAALALVADASA
jgi:Arc/MetJ-type ribon-helix-helix transcriptional regulator